jgi:exonuclease SbcC
MKLNALRLQNFRQHADTRIEFDRGLTGIIGSNGSGKTTILEAIAWALYGQAAARGTRDSIRFTGAPSRAAVRVELDFELAGHRYRVVRGLTSAEVFLDGGAEPIANSLTGVSELLQRRLGMTRDEFFHTYFTGQKELDVMAAMTPAARAQFLSRVLGYEKLRSAQILVRDRRKLVLAELTGLKSAMRDPAVVDAAVAAARARVSTADGVRNSAEKTFDVASARLAVVAPRWAEAQAARDRAQALLSELRVADNEALSLADQIGRVDRDAAEIATARTELESLAHRLAPMAEVMREFQAFEALAREEGRRLTLLESEKSLAEELARLRERRDRLATAPQLEEEVTLQLEAARRALEAAQGELEARRTDWVRDKQEAETKRNALRQQYAELNEQRERVVTLGAEGTCPTCARPLGQSYRAVIDAMDAQVESVLVDGNYFKSRLEQLEEMPPEVKALDEKRRQGTTDLGALERKLAKVQAAVQELRQLAKDVAAKEERLAQLQQQLADTPGGYDAVRHAELRARIEELTTIDSRAARLGALVDRESQVQRERARLVGLRTEVADRQARLATERDASAFREETFAALRADHEASASAARLAELAVVAARADVDSASQALGRAMDEAAEMARVRERLDALANDKRMHDELDRAFSDLRTDLNAQLRPELSELASAFLAELTDGRYGELELDDEYTVLVLEDGVPKPVISGGEEDLANLVLRLAISQMIAERSGQAFSLLVLDEVFGSLDETRRQHVVELLRRLQDRFEQVILITHIDDVREGLDRVISVRYDEEKGSSVVEMADGGMAGEVAVPVGAGAED